MTDQHAEFVATPEIVDRFLARIEIKPAHKRPRWSASEIAIMRQHYPTGGAPRCRALLPERRTCAIHWRARTLGLSAPKNDGRAERIITTQFIDDAIRRYYVGTPKRGGLSKLAHQLHRPPAWVAARARRLGITREKFPSLPWSEPEIALLRQHAAKIPGNIEKILLRKGFRRTTGAIARMITLLHCDRSDDDHYTASGLAGLLGVQAKVVCGWIAKGWLKAQTRGTTREHDIYRIRHSNVRRFVIDNVGAVDLRRVDKYWFVDLIAGA
jgi:hypothetical protein